MFPSLISITLTWFVPESPRWLVAKGKVAKARKILLDYHCGGDESDPLVDFEMHEIESTLAFEREQGNGGWTALFRTKGNRWRTWVVASCSILSQATGTTLIGYYLVVVLTGIGVTNPRTQSIINGCLTLSNMLFAFWGAYVIDKFGRRRMMLTSLTGQLICGFIPWTVRPYALAVRCSSSSAHVDVRTDLQCAIYAIRQPLRWPRRYSFHLHLLCVLRHDLEWHSHRIHRRVHVL